MNKVAAYARLLRIPGLAALATPTIIAAITVGVKDIYSFSLLFIIGAFAAIYGFILNDYSDVELDKLIPELHGKPLVSGDISKKNALTICIFLILLTFLFIFNLWKGKTLDEYKFMALICIILAGILGSFYNIYGKKIAGSDFFVAISMSFVFLFGALSFGAPGILTWIIFILTFNQTLHMNAVEGGIKDADHDYKMGVSNIALNVGVKVKGENIFIPNSFKIFGMGIRLFSIFLLFSPFLFFNISYSILQLALLALGSFGVLFFSLRLLTLKKFDRSIIRKYIGIQSFLRYSLVPIMLLSTVGETITIILIVFPIGWYIIFAPLIGEKLFKPRM
ncbi:MAG: UbiA family prenyltransferase [Candidatus Thermoplasmatota archaeon]|nr:UbiA family prenyltransferase [Candidatus Thermoplasmatota archaeon]